MKTKVTDEELILNTVLSMVQRTRLYMGQHASAPYARAAKDVLLSLRIIYPSELDDMISRGFRDD